MRIQTIDFVTKSIALTVRSYSTFMPVHTASCIASSTFFKQMFLFCSDIPLVPSGKWYKEEAYYN